MDRQRFFVTLVLSLVLLVAAAPALAQPAGNCAVPPGLAASLLFPYFEVNLLDEGGVTTLISVNNGLAGDALARVVVWSDWGVPTLAFDLWLNAFDVQTINLRSVLEGNIPSTGAGEDLSGFEFCSGSLVPSHSNPVLSNTEIGQLRSDHLGVEGPLFSNCVGAAYGDGIARGYITVDVVDECSGIESGSPFFSPANQSWPYFSTGGMVNAIATNDNRLWGDVVFVDFTGKAAQGSQAVPLWASTSQHPGPNAYTFYGRFHNWDGRDHRVPLPYRWDQRFLNGGVFGGGADMIVWRDPEVPTAPAACGSQPAPFPLKDGSVALDEESMTYVLGNTNFPLATQRVPIGSLGVPVDFGWLQVTMSLPSGQFNQSWVETTLTSSAFELSAAWPGTPVSFLCGFDPTAEP